MWPLQKRYSWSYISILWLGVILILLFISTEDIHSERPRLFPHADKVIHACLFAIWAYCLSRMSLQQYGVVKYTTIAITIAVVGIVTELLQGVTTYRTSDPWDVLADIIGGVLVLGAFKFMLKRN